MAITTNSAKLAVMEMGNVWEPGLPLSPGSLGQNDQQQLLHGYPSILWGAGGEVIASAWCGLTGMSGMSGGGGILELGS